MAVLDRFLELGIDTWLLVGEKKTDHARVVPVYSSPFFDYRGCNAAIGRTKNACCRRIDRWLGLEDFNFPHTCKILELTGSPPDLVLCHNLHGGYFDLRALSALSKRVPVALRLFDSWLLTGHCAKTFGCERWRTGCGRCPDLSIPPAIRRDATRFNWRRKRSIFRRSRIYASAESQWMIDRVRQSLLAAAVAQWKLIPGGVDLQTFSPRPQPEARRAMGLDEDAHILLYVANLGASNVFKDFATVREALSALAERMPGKRIQLLGVGSTGPEEQIAPNVVLRWLGYIRSRTDLADLYRAADVFVHAAIDETFGLSVAEALACGTPVVTASTGGVLEIVEQERTALIVGPRDASGLANAIARLLDDPPLRAAMSAECAEWARARLDERAMIGSIFDWCTDIHQCWARAS